MRRAPVLLLVAMLAIPVTAAAVPAGGEDPRIGSLQQLSIEALRNRQYGSVLTIETLLGSAAGESSYSKYYGAPYYNTFMAAYQSDGLRVYTRVDVPPVTMPAAGYPVIIIAHGWVGAKGAPGYGFQYKPNAYWGLQIDSWVKAGYVVLTPGFRGHGTVNGIPAEGLEYIQAYDNGSYLSPMFYAIDALNLLEGVSTLDSANWSRWGFPAAGRVRVDTRRIFLVGHSQGGDVALTALTVASSQHIRNAIAGASIFNGCFEGRIEQGAFYGPQENAFGVRSDPAYFPHMPYWWPADDSWYWLTIEEAVEYKKKQMYNTVRTYVANQKHADPASNSLLSIMTTLDAYKHPQYIKAPLDLHFSDWDHYSIPAWNAALVRKVRALGGTANAYQYAGNSHELTVDPTATCAPDACVEGRQTAIQRTIELFNGIK